MKKLTIIASTLVLVACGGAKVITITQADAERVTTKFPGVTMQELQEGQKLYAANCVQCHKLFAPGRYTEKTWNEIIPGMSKAAKIDAKTQETITRYILTFAKQ